jgi:hypothetical protein
METACRPPAESRFILNFSRGFGSAARGCVEADPTAVRDRKMAGAGPSEILSRAAGKFLQKCFEPFSE